MQGEAERARSRPPSPQIDPISRCRFDRLGDPQALGDLRHRGNVSAGQPVEFPMPRAPALMAAVPFTVLATSLAAQSPTGAWFGEIRGGDSATPVVITLDTAAGGLEGEVVLPLAVPHQGGVVRLVRLAPPDTSAASLLAGTYAFTEDSLLVLETWSIGSFSSKPLQGARRGSFRSRGIRSGLDHRLASTSRRWDS